MQLKSVESAKDLGVTKKYDLSWGKHVSYTVNNANWQTLEKRRGFFSPVQCYKIVLGVVRAGSLTLLLVFRVAPFRINQNNNQNRSIDKVQNRREERR